MRPGGVSNSQMSPDGVKKTGAVESDRESQLSRSSKCSQRSLGLLLLFVSCITSRKHASVHKGRIWSDNRTCCHSTPTQGQPVPTLNLKRQASGRVATGVPVSKSLVSLDREIDSRGKRELNLGLLSLSRRTLCR